MHQRPLALAAAIAVIALAVAEPATAQRQGRIAGVVTDAERGRPITGVTINVIGTSIGALTGTDGRYVLSNVTPGVVALGARRLGFGEKRTANIRVAHDSVTTVNFALSDNPLRLDNIVVSATIDPMSSLKVPFTVARLSAADIPVAPTTNVAAALIGKVAGAHINRQGGPGGQVFVQLRSPTSQLKSTTPLYVVDGVMLSTTIVNPLQDINSEDIESVEVIKGASAASLYGSRAANGVISIRTNRGANLALNATEIGARTEYGFNQTGKTLEKPRFHRFLVNPAGEYVNAAGVVVPRVNRVVDPDGFIDNPFVGTTYDHPSDVFRAGRFSTNTATLSQNTAATNFAASYSRARETGIIFNSDGLIRQNVRLNLDHRLREDFRIGVSGSHSRSVEDPSSVVFADLYRIDSDIDLRAPNADGTPFRVLPDTLSSMVNPLYRQQYNDDITRRARTLLNADASYRPLHWLSIDGNISYDRSDRQRSNFIPRGILGLDGQTPTIGSLFYDDDTVDGLNAKIGTTGTFTRNALTSRLTLQSLLERESNPYFSTTGTDFSVDKIKDINLARVYSASSSYTDRRATSYLGSLTTDYAGKYIGDFLLRRDGNSLFGPEARWNNYYRASGSYLMAEESWWPFASLGAFKVHYSIGTGGTRPDFSDQYENVTVDAGGGVSRQSLGNVNLRPEVATEQEIGVDAIYRNRISLSLAYARVNSRDNIISVPVPGRTGFNTQEQNVGRTTGNTIEATIQAQLISRPRFQWEMNLVADRSRNQVAEFNRSCYGDGLFFRCEGNTMGWMYGNEYIRSTDHLRPVHVNSGSQFQVNDDGFLVAVGQGGSYRDAKWGQAVTVDGIAYPWGMPIIRRDSLGQVALLNIGDSNPDMSFGVGNTVTWGGFRLYGLVSGQVGGQIYNNTRQTLYQSLDHIDVVQVNKPAELKKPSSYYTGQNGLAFNNSGYINHFVETAAHAKLNEASIRYTFSESSLGLLKRFGVNRMSVDLIGRNMFIWTKYTGIDPEHVSSGQPFSRIEFEVYPLYRTFTTGFNLVF